MRLPAAAALAAIALATAGLAVWWQVRAEAPVERPELQRVLDRLVSGAGRAAPGATAYVSGPRGTWAGAAGLADVRRREPMRPDARMRLESVSKLWTAVVLVRLSERGVVGLEDTVESVLPGLLPAGGRITVRQLLDHTSGLVDNNDIGSDPLGHLRRVRDPRLRAELLRALRRLRADPEYEFPTSLSIRFAAALPLRFEPGTAYHYSNIGYMIAGRVAERASGRAFAQLVESEIAAPLGLRSAAYDPRSRITGPHARGYALAPDGTLTDTTRRVEDLGPHGGVVADAPDEGRFLAALMRGDLVGPAGLAALKAPSAHEPYALGTGVEETACGTAYSHGGAGSGFVTNAYVSGDGARVAVVLLNARTPDSYGDLLVKDAARTLFCAA